MVKEAKKHPRAHFRARPPSEMASADSILLDEVAAERLTGFSRNTFRVWRRTARGPTLVKVGRTIRYRRSDLLAFVNEHAVSPEAYAAGLREKLAVRDER